MAGWHGGGDTQRTCVVVAPGQRVARAADQTAATALAAPGAARHVGQLRARAVRVPRGVAVVAQQQQRLVTARPAALAHRAVQAAPSHCYYHLRYLSIISHILKHHQVNYSTQSFCCLR